MSTIDLSTISTRAPEHLDKDEARKISAQRAERIAELHAQLVAERKHAVLVILQGMDASGKDGAMRRVFGACSPFGLRAVGWKKPTEEEFAHDFLWRIHKQVPAKGELVIFNRSHYEDVLIQRVHGWISEAQVDQRIASINAFEKLLQQDNNTLILKFYLHLSYEQQEEELRERLEEPEKHYKHNDGDWAERERWDDYRAAYEDVIGRSELTWHIVPVDQRWYRDYVMTEVVLNALEGLNMSWPALATELTHQ
ncbi:Polyphosphate:AMP/ADP phosphotransferase [Neolewinella maritima]|uniref:Polyphosphate:AMP/ADP phosphotransferase n=1 Tax=Neolewinella maritima TaxID=1383882 RepID=A0ABM9AZD3_9BACT|nr:PPK2 family polyphosphate kinase [Neolewinella maritima]CAH1000157.1 Polyphosphate:AMP/ADP phosphotransferase [Neolewinella maritima]